MLTTLDGDELGLGHGGEPLGGLGGAQVVIELGNHSHESLAATGPRAELGRCGAVQRR